MRPADFPCTVQVESVMSEIDIFVSSTSTHHFGPQEEVEEQHARWKHRTLGQRDRLSWLTRLGRRESRHHQASAPLITVIVITERAR